MFKSVGLFHPEIGYWEAVIPASADETKFTPPAGAVNIPLRPSPFHALLDGTWVLDAAAALGDAKARATSGMVAWISALLASLTAGYPPEEVASWPVKAAAARLHLSGAPQAMIEIEAQITGEAPDDLARSIVARADKTAAIMAATAGLRRTTAAAIAAAETPEAVAGALAEAQKSALSMAAQMGLPQTKDQTNA